MRNWPKLLFAVCLVIVESQRSLTEQKFGRQLRVFCLGAASKLACQCICFLKSLLVSGLRRKGECFSSL